MLIDLEALAPGAARAHGRPAQRTRRPTVAETTVALWDEDDLPAMLRAEADGLARESVIRLLGDYRAMLDEIGTVRAVELAGLRENTEVLIAGRRVSTARSGTTTVVSIEDGTGRSAAEFAPDAQGRTGSVLFGTDPMLIAGTTTTGASLRATNAWSLKQLLRDWRAQRDDRPGSDAS
jgi:error-prone DNA polymerase